MSLTTILLLKSFAEIVAEEYFPDRKSPEEQRKPEADKVFNRTQEMLFELVAVKPAAGEFRLFRVGAGGAAFDRTCSYFNKF